MTYTLRAKNEEKMTSDNYYILSEKKLNFFSFFVIFLQLRQLLLLNFFSMTQTFK